MIILQADALYWNEYRRLFIGFLLLSKTYNPKKTRKIQEKMILTAAQNYMSAFFYELFVFSYIGT